MVQFQLTEELINRIADLISSRKNSTLKNLVKDIHYADMADVINSLSEDEGTYLIKLFDSERTSEILTELDENVREKILKNKSSLHFKCFISFLENLTTADSTLGGGSKNEGFSENKKSVTKKACVKTDNIPYTLDPGLEQILSATSF